MADEQPIKRVHYGPIVLEIDGEEVEAFIHPWVDCTGGLPLIGCGFPPKFSPVPPREIWADVPKAVPAPEAEPARADRDGLENPVHW